MGRAGTTVAGKDEDIVRDCHSRTGRISVSISVHSLDNPTERGGVARALSVSPQFSWLSLHWCM